MIKKLKNYLINLSTVWSKVEGRKSKVNLSLKFIIQHFSFFFSQFFGWICLFVELCICKNSMIKKFIHHSQFKTHNSFHVFPSILQFLIIDIYSIQNEFFNFSPENLSDHIDSVIFFSIIKIGQTF